eukprot:CAMPEP_0196601854 /NCGR_PEP_ID=MMETSP1081-20130531/96128_1 /TAXON_ID=36882 /ORGANISM="Pyramimonas amylifera, Strain CCMP720" /LENGTH=140 /DNA_ID=CAMNT_0041927751 /DNA_START=582 /DNA_END=1005 /DNA_ORIENTATION=-
MLAAGLAGEDGGRCAVSLGPGDAGAQPKGVPPPGAAGGGFLKHQLVLAQETVVRRGANLDMVTKQLKLRRMNGGPPFLVKAMKDANDELRIAKGVLNNMNSELKGALARQKKRIIELTSLTDEENLLHVRLRTLRNLIQL